MIEGLFEAHLPVRDLERSIKFYQGLGLELDHKSENTGDVMYAATLVFKFDLSVEDFMLAHI